MVLSRVLSTSSAAARRRRIVVAMSGGVDSSVAAFLLQQNSSSNDIHGLYMSNWDPRDEDEQQQQQICSEADFKDCQTTCRKLHIPLHYASFEAEYWTGVFEPYVDAIQQGQMPNPDVGCNAIVKFGAMKEYAHKSLNADYIATGHYARLWHGENKHQKDAILNEEATHELVETIFSQDADLSAWLPKHHNNSTPMLLAGADLTKDQSYFLCRVAGKSFCKVLFPLGNYMKNNSTNSSNKITTRQLAQEAGLDAVKNKRESMGICFVGKRRKFASFMQQYLPDMDNNGGNFINIDTGQVVGQYKKQGGVHQYVTGQGAKIGGASQKWFVAGRHKQDILVCGGTHHPALYANELYVKDMHWIAGKLPPPLLQHQMMRAWCRTRHLQPLIPCQVQRDEKEDCYTIRFDTPVRAITPGQIAAIYVGLQAQVCLGGGPIWDRGPTYFELGRELPQVLHPAGQNDLSVKKRIS